MKQEQSESSTCKGIILILLLGFLAGAIFHDCAYFTDPSYSQGKTTLVLVICQLLIGLIGSVSTAVFGAAIADFGPGY